MSTPTLAPPPPAPARLPPPPKRRPGEKVIEAALLACGLLSILITVSIVVIVLTGTAEFVVNPAISDRLLACAALFGVGTTAGVAALRRRRRAEAGGLFALAALAALVAAALVRSAPFAVNPFFSLKAFLFGTDDPNEEVILQRFGIVSYLCGTLLVAVIAALVALPLGLTAAIYLSEYAGPRTRNVVKPTLELLAGIPTVVYGYFALTTVTPFLALFVPGLNQPFNQLAGGVVVGVMILPLVASLSEDAIRAVPRALREGSYALGANQFETSVRVVVPAALSGILASFVLALSRAVGETMAVTLACGAKPQLTLDPREGLATMTSFIVNKTQGDVRYGTPDFNSLYAMAAVLFFLTLSMNFFAQWVLRRYRQVYQ
jgi:phosphate transport system permease protein